MLDHKLQGKTSFIHYWKGHEKNQQKAIVLKSVWNSDDIYYQNPDKLFELWTEMTLISITMSNCWRNLALFPLGCHGNGLIFCRPALGQICLSPLHTTLQAGASSMNVPKTFENWAWDDTVCHWQIVICSVYRHMYQESYAESCLNDANLGITVLFICRHYQ